jgi:hypothetical protein
VIALADHFEPSIQLNTSAHALRDVQLARVERWAKEYPAAVEPFRDADGHPFKHTYFYPAEQYDADVTSLLAEHCRRGYGEIEVHLHHGVDMPDTSENTRSRLTEFVRRLGEHGCLAREYEGGPLRYAFVHGNWALGNSAGGSCCGVDDELQILAETGCYADFTLPSAPDISQVPKTNSIYECGYPLGNRVPHRTGRDLSVGTPPRIYPIIIQGPLMLSCKRRGSMLRPAIENAELSGANPATLKRFQRWSGMKIGVAENPDWAFVKLHCHGMDPRDSSAMYGDSFQAFLAELTAVFRGKDKPRLHFTTAREMANMIFAACDGQSGSPNDFRDYRFRPAATLA